MSENYKPGDIVCVRYDEGDLVGIVRPRKSANGELEVAYANGGFDMLADLPDDLRAHKLVALNLDYIRHEPFGLPKVLDTLRAFSSTVAIADQIEAQTRPPKPAEPLDVGAVIQDRESMHWVRTILLREPGHKAWRKAHATDSAPLTKYEDIDVTKVIRAEVSA